MALKCLPLQNIKMPMTYPVLATTKLLRHYVSIKIVHVTLCNYALALQVHTLSPYAPYHIIEIKQNKKR